MIEPETFTEMLRERSEPEWTQVITHPFTLALFDGSLPDEKMRGYLVQDYQFIDDFLALLGSALAKADRYAARLSIAANIAVVSGEENTYFRRAFGALDVPERDRSHPKMDEASVAFRELMTDVNANGSYAEVLSVLGVAEWSYWEWARRAPEQLPESFLHSEWIELHRRVRFRAWVDWLRSELDRVGAELDDRGRARCLRVFRQAVVCELDFFNAHWY